MLYEHGLVISFSNEIYMILIFLHVGMNTAFPEKGYGIATRLGAVRVVGIITILQHFIYERA